MVNFVSGPAFAFHDRQFRSRRLDKGPMLFLVRPNAALVDPCPQRGNLLRRQALAFGGHYLVRVLRNHSQDDLALGALARQEKRFTGFATSQRIRLSIQPQVVFLFIRPVTLETALNENGLNISREIDLGLLGRQGQITHQQGRCCSRRRKAEGTRALWVRFLTSAATGRRLQQTVEYPSNRRSPTQYR